MMIVYGAKAFHPMMKGRIRDVRVLWALEEMGQPYEHRILDAAEKHENRAPDYLKQNLFGKVPTLVDGDFTLFESGAICLYLGDKFKKLVPASGTRERALLQQWIFAATTTLEPHCYRVFISDYLTEKNETNAAIRKISARALEFMLKQIDADLASRDWIAGPEFSMADIFMACVLYVIADSNLIAPDSATAKYLARCFERPAYKIAFAKNAGV